MRNLEELDITPTPTSARRMPADDLMIAAFEKRFKVRLPDDLRRFLKEIPGGYPRLSVFRKGRHPWEVNSFVGLARDDESESLSDVTAQLAHVLGPGEIPFAQTAGGNPFIVDARKTPSPVLVILFDDGLRRVPVAESFTEFIDGLEDVPDDEL